MAKRDHGNYPNLQRHYLPHVDESRGRMARDARLRALLEGDLDSGEMLGFLLEFCALGTRMCADVDAWMRRAGQACVRAGRRELGLGIARRAVEESGHDSLLLEDLFDLARLWRRRVNAEIEVEELLRQPPPDAVLRYAELHESVIASPRPWAQLGIELEIENMSTVIGPPLIERCRAQLGGAVLHALSFIRRHVELDHVHIETNARRIDALLGREPALGGTLARAGRESLNIYLDFLGDCVELGCELAGRARFGSRGTAPTEELPSRERIPALAFL